MSKKNARLWVPPNLMDRNVARGIYEQAFWPAEVPEKYIQTITSLYLRLAQF